MDYFHGILIHLYENGCLDRSVSINDFLINVMGDDKNTPTELTGVMVALGNLHQKTFVFAGQIPLLGRAGNGKDFNNLENNPNIRVTLLHNGYTYISEKIRLENQDKLSGDQANSILQTNENVRETNISIKKTNKLLITTNIVSVMIAAFTGLFIALQFFKDDGSIPQSTNTLLKQQKQILDSTIQIQREIDSSLKTLGKRDSSKKK